MKTYKGMPIVWSAEFFAPGKPATKKNTHRIYQKKNGQQFIANAPKTVKAEKALATRAKFFRPDRPWDGPVVLRVEFILPVPKSWPRWKASAAYEGRIVPIVRPDVPNMLELVCDALQGIFYKDDAQVFCPLVSKVYGEVSGTRIRVEFLQGATRESESARSRL